MSNLEDKVDKRYVLSAFGYAIVGLVLGIYMASSKDHSQLVAHAHIMLLGFVVSFIYAVCVRLWLSDKESRMLKLQFYLHQLGTLLTTLGLFLLYGAYVPAESIGPGLGIGSVLVLLGMVMMKVMFIKATKE